MLNREPCPSTNLYNISAILNYMHSFKDACHYISASKKRVLTKYLNIESLKFQLLGKKVFMKKLATPRLTLAMSCLHYSVD